MSQQARAQVRLYDTTGRQVAIFDTWRTLELQRRVNTYDLLTFAIDGADDRIDLFVPDAPIEVWRKLADIPATRQSYTAPGGYAYMITQDGAIVYYRLNEPIGQISASDSSGHGNTGVYAGGITLEQPGALAPELNGTSDTAALFDGTSGLITLSRALPAMTAIALEAWVNPNLASTATTVTILRGPDATTPRIERTAAAGLALFVWGVSPSGSDSLTSTSLPQNVWSHVVGTHDGTTARLYVNGIEVASKASTLRTIPSSSGWVVGELTGSTRFWPGRLDEVAIYPTALSAAQVAAHYAAGLNQHNSSTRTYVIYVPGTTYEWYRESTLLHRTPGPQITERGTRIFTSYSRGLLDLLHRREIQYFANTAFTLKGGPGDTVLKEYVNENAGPGANNAARAADGTTPGLSIEPSTGAAPVFAGQRSWQNLLDLAQEIASATGLDFDIVRTDTPGSGAVTMEFRTYYPQLGTDRTATVIFATKFGNMVSPYYTKSRTEEINRVTALGPGQDSARRVMVRENLTNQAASPWNIIERTVDARQEDTLTGLQAAADAVLNESGPQEQFTFQVLQTDSLQYGRDYFLGDVVTAAFENYVTASKKIVGVTLNISEGKENISMAFADVPEYS